MQETKRNYDMCHTQLMRMSGMANFPAEDEAIGELVETLMESCRDEAHLAATVRAWVRRQAWAPKPVDLAMQAAEFPRDEREDPRCSQCRNAGLISRRMLVTRRVVGGKADVDPLPEPQDYAELQAQNARLADGQEIMNFGDYCDCPKGRRMREGAEAEREHKAAKSPVQKAGKMGKSSEADWKRAAGGE